MLSFIHMVVPRIRIYLPKSSYKLFFRCLLKKQLISGPAINEFEKQFSSYIGTKYAVAVSSGRIGLYLTLKVLGIKKGDKIILSSYNSPVVPNIVRAVNATPVFVDINPDTLNMENKSIKEKITKRTRSIIALHTEGQPCEIDKIIKIVRKYRPFVIEDCAHSVGAKYKNKIVGSTGDVSFFSFGIGKFINTLGGGMVVTNNKKIAGRIRTLIKSFNEPNRFVLTRKFILANLLSFLTNPIIFSLFVYPFLIISNLFRKDIIYRFFEDVGTTGIKQKNLIRFSNFQALLGLEQMRNLEIRLKKQRYNIDTLIRNINRKKVKFQKAVFNSQPVYLHFTLLSRNRSKLMIKLLWKGIDTQVSWMKSCSSKGECQISDMLSERAIYIPIYHDLTEKDIKYIADVLNSE